MAITRLGGANAITGTIPTSVAPGRGSYIKIANADFSSVSSITLDNFTTDYKLYFFRINFDFGSVTNKRLNLVLRSSSSDLTSGYHSSADYVNAGVNSGSIQSSNSASSISLTGDVDTVGNGHIFFQTPAQSSFITTTESTFITEDSSNTQRILGFASRDTEEANNGFKISVTGDTISGSYALYGVNE
jgi:hypothetical protein